MTVKEKRLKRAALVKEAREILDLIEKDKREMSAEEEHRYEEIMVDVDKMGDEIEAEVKREERAKHLSDVEADLETPVDEPIKPDPEDAEMQKRATDKYNKAFRHYLGAIDKGAETRALNELFAEQRALQMDIDTSGGYTIAPQQFVANLIKAMDNQVFMRGLATTYNVPKAESLGAPSLDTDPADPTWTAEILVGNEDSSTAFGKRELYPHPLAQYIKISKKLIRASALNIEQIVRSRLIYKASVVEENAFLNGDGSNEPLGVFTASDSGISTTYDISTDNTSTNIKADGLINAKYGLKSGYWKRARWIFHRDAVKMIRKLKDGEGQYMWRPGIASDRGDTILDVPVIMSEYAPNTFTASLYVGIIGDFSYYWIATALDMTIQVLVELYAATNQNGYILRLESDGMPVLGEAFRRVKLSA